MRLSEEGKERLFFTTELLQKNFELELEIDELKKENEELEKENDALKTINEVLNQKIDRLLKEDKDV